MTCKIIFIILKKRNKYAFYLIFLILAFIIFTVLRLIMSNTYKDLSFLKKYRKDWGLTQDDLIQEIYEKTGKKVSRRTLQYWEKGEKTPRGDTIKKIYQFIHRPEKNDADFSLNKISKLPSMQISYEDRARNSAHLATIIQLGLVCVSSARWYIAHPSYQIEVPSDKLNSLDYLVQQKLINKIKELVSIDEHPWFPGIHLVSENFCEYFGDESKKDVCKIYLLSDPVDYSAGAMRRGEGSILLTVYHKDKGILATVIVEILGNLMFYRMAGEVSKQIPYLLNKDPILVDREQDLKASLHGPGNDLLPGHSLHILDNANVNIFRGRPDRELLFLEKGKGLLEGNFINEIFSIGGALPMIRVCEGLIDCCIEWKGFFYPVFAPGGFISEGSGLIVRDFDNNDYTFGPDCISEEYLCDGYLKKDHLRCPFICCSTSSLYDDIIKKLQ